MSEDKTSLINLVPESIDNAAKNLTDNPTQNMGTTLADIWYLVFGGISQAAEKRKLKYSYALQEFEKELKENISKIPEDQKVEPDIQVVAPALEAAKYYIEKKELRKMFINLISSSLNLETCSYAHPYFVHIIKQLSSTEAKLLQKICDLNGSITYPSLYKDTDFSLNILQSNGLIMHLEDEFDDADVSEESYGVTILGAQFCKVCISDKFNSDIFYS